MALAAVRYCFLASFMVSQHPRCNFSLVSRFCPGKPPIAGCDVTPIIESLADRSLYFLNLERLNDSPRPPGQITGRDRTRGWNRELLFLPLDDRRVREWCPSDIDVGPMLGPAFFADRPQR